MLCCIEIADQKERLQLPQGEAGKDSVFVQMPCHNAYNNKIAQYLYLLVPRTSKWERDWMSPPQMFLFKYCEHR